MNKSVGMLGLALLCGLGAMYGTVKLISKDKAPAAEKQDVIVAVRENKETKEKSIIRIRDVAEVKDEWEEERGLSRLDGDAAISLIVQKQSGGNTVAVADAVKARLKQIE